MNATFGNKFKEFAVFPVDIFQKFSKAEVQLKDPGVTLWGPCEFRAIDLRLGCLLYVLISSRRPVSRCELVTNAIISLLLFSHTF